MRPLQKDDFEIVFTAYLQPLLQKKRSGSHQLPEDVVKSLRKMLK
jgi:hypothetical protein